MLCPLCHAKPDEMCRDENKTLRLDHPERPWPRLSVEAKHQPDRMLLSVARSLRELAQKCEDMAVSG